ncbi:MAG: hypothetical protein IJ566_06910, partial [Cardiobacteriaceae bacterium]|nr:hypothetical protein [Cardiobacteriaceae bacterium]
VKPDFTTPHKEYKNYLVSEKFSDSYKDFEAKSGGSEAVANVKPDPVIEALNQATPTPGKPNQLETILDDGFKVIFRKDFGKNAHPLNDPNRKLTGKGDIEHYNIKFHSPSTTKPGRFKQEVDWHIVPNSNGTEPIYFPTYPNKKKGK